MKCILNVAGIGPQDHRQDACNVSAINLQGGHGHAGSLVSGQGTWVTRDRCRLVYKFWRDDFIDFRRHVRQELGKGRPVFAFGESMGALVTLQAAPAAELAGVILSSPVVKFRQDTPLPWWQELLVKILFRCAPWYRLDLQAFSKKDAPAPVITRDQAYLERIRNAPYRIPRFTVGFYRELIRLVLATPGAASRLRMPVLVLAAGQDVFVRPEDVTSFFEALPGPDKTLHTYPSSYHLLVRDFEAAQVIRDVHAWLDERTSAA
jgi:alpha-beta hydrolase superfamily lysophospholipase